MRMQRNKQALEESNSKGPGSSEEVQEITTYTDESGALQECNINPYVRAFLRLKSALTPPRCCSTLCVSRRGSVAS